MKILVVEDNKIYQTITKKMLGKLNLDCDIVDNGQDAVKSVQDSIYDVVLMDINMPGMSGFEATKLIRSFDKNLSIFAITSATLDGRHKEFEEAGFSGIIPKPFTPEAFERQLITRNAV